MRKSSGVLGGVCRTRSGTVETAAQPSRSPRLGTLKIASITAKQRSRTTSNKIQLIRPWRGKLFTSFMSANKPEVVQRVNEFSHRKNIEELISPVDAEIDGIYEGGFFRTVFENAHGISGNSTIMPRAFNGVFKSAMFHH